MKIQQQQHENEDHKCQLTSQKPLQRFSQSKSTIAGSFWLLKKMVTEVLLVLPSDLILLFICCRFRHLIKMMADVGDTLNDDDFLGDIVDTPKEGIQQHKKPENV